MYVASLSSDAPVEARQGISVDMIDLGKLKQTTFGGEILATSGNVKSQRKHGACQRHLPENGGGI